MCTAWTFDVPHIVLFRTKAHGLSEVLCETDMWLPGIVRPQVRPSHTMMSWCFHSGGRHSQSFWEGHTSRTVAAHGRREEAMSSLERVAAPGKLRELETQRISWYLTVLVLSSSSGFRNVSGSILAKCSKVILQMWSIVFFYKLSPKT